MLSCVEHENSFITSGPESRIWKLTYHRIGLLFSETNMFVKGFVKGGN